MAGDNGAVDGTFCEFLDFLVPGTRVDILTTALQYAQGLTSTADGLHMFEKDDYSLADRLVVLAVDPSLASDATTRAIIAGILTNVCADSPPYAKRLLQSGTVSVESYSKFFSMLCQDCREVSCEVSAKLLSNLAVHDPEATWRQLQKHWPDFLQCAIELLKTPSIASENQSVEYIGFALRSLTALDEVRQALLVVPSKGSTFSSKIVLFELFPLIKQQGVVPLERRRIAVDVLRNLCFDDQYVLDNHGVLLDEEEFLPTLLWGLIGGEELAEDENDKLPIDLQYMDSAKQREPDLYMRQALLEALYQGREHLRNSGTYYVLREYHKWEKDPNADRLISNVVGVLIRNESEMCLTPGEPLRNFMEKTEDAQ